MINRLILLFFFFSCLYGTAQTADGPKANVLKTAYYGRNFTHPGVKIGIETDLITFNSGKKERSAHGLILNNNVGYYYHPRNHHGLFFTSELMYFMKFKNGFALSFGGGIGYNRIFYDAQVYEVDDNGEVQKILLAGDNFLIPSARIEIADRIEKSEKLDSWYLAIGSFWQYPYNGQFLLNPTIEIGVNWKLNQSDK